MNKTARDRLRIRHVNPGKLTPWEGNPRVNDEAVEPVARSIERFGFNVPIVCNQTLGIIAGHTRWKAALKLGLSKVPVVLLDIGNTDAVAFALAENRLSQIAEWDFDGLGEVLSELVTNDADVKSLGFSEEEIAAMMTPESEVEWRDLEEHLQSTSTKEFVLHPVKIKPAEKKAFRSKLDRLAKEHGIRHRDGAVRAGRVLCSLLGIEE